VRAATIQAGGVAQAMEALRDQRGLPWLQDLVSDLRYGCRILAKNPGFTLVAVLSLAIGIGANTAVFSFADTLLLRPLTVPRPGEVLTVGSISASTIRPILLASYRDYVDVRDRSRSFEGLVAFSDTVVGFASGPDILPKLTIGMLVTANFFPVMGVEPALGRAFRPDEDQVPGRDAVVMLGHAFWQREFGADRAIIGRAIRLNGIEFTVIGVTPARFTGMDQYVRSEFFTPLMMWPRLVPDARVPPFEARDLRTLDVRGRLKRGVTLAQANTELSLRRPRFLEEVAKLTAMLRQCSPDVEQQLLRIAQEAISNAVQHGRADEVVIELDYQGNSLSMSIRDNGCGFVPEQEGARSGEHWGLVNMRERITRIRGQLSVTSAVGQGTVVTTISPIGS